jgi:hypothetical protein
MTKEDKDLLADMLEKIAKGFRSGEYVPYSLGEAFEIGLHPVVAGDFLMEESRHTGVTTMRLTYWRSPSNE